MSFVVNGHNIFVVVGVCFLASLVFVEMMKRVAKFLKVLDYPNDKRKIHKEPMPLLGGIGIFLAFLLGYMIFGEQTTMMNSILIGSFVLLITGIIDDIKPLKAKYKLIGQIMAALIVVFYGNLLLFELAIMHNYCEKRWCNIVMTTLSNIQRYIFF